MRAYRYCSRSVVCLVGSFQTYVQVIGNRGMSLWTLLLKSTQRRRILRLSDRVAFGCVVRLPRRKLQLPLGRLFAETVGFEPTDGLGPSADFKSVAFNPSATSPKNRPSGRSKPRGVRWAFCLSLNILRI